MNHEETIHNTRKTAPIGVFDSGLGGISVLREMAWLMPHENFIYLGDSLNAPYGTKTLEEVRKLTYASFENLLGQGVKAVAIACNTATSAAVRSLRQDYPDIPLIGIEPALKPAVLAKPNSRIAVMATPMTLRQQKFQALKEKYEDQAEILSLPCPGLMEFIERGMLEGEELEAYLKEHLAPSLEKPLDAIVLGCTHYPFVRPVIEKVAGPDVAIYDGGEGCAREMRRRLREKDLENDQEAPGTVVFQNSLDTPEEEALAWRLFRS